MHKKTYGLNDEVIGQTMDFDMSFKFTIFLWNDHNRKSDEEHCIPN